MAEHVTTLSKFNEIFSKVLSIEQYPSREELQNLRIPFHQQLADLAHSDKYKAHNEHVCDVVVKANTLINKGPSCIVTDLTPDDELSKRLDNLFLQLPLWARNYNMESHAIIRSAAVYHDIGKWIIKDRHPTEGFYLLQYLFPDEKNNLLLMVGRNAFDLLLTVIRDHDKFGIMSTGEASLLVMVDMLNPARTEIQFYKMSVLTLLMTNFADIAVTAPNGFGSLQAKWIEEDISQILDALDEGKGDRLQISWKLLEMDRQARRTTGRIARLVDSCYKNAKKNQRDLAEKALKELKKEDSKEMPPENLDLQVRFHEDDWESIDYNTIVDSVNRKLQTIFLGAAYQRFCSDFAHFCKLDYALYFLGEVARQFNLKKLKENRQDYPIDDLVASVIYVLKSIVETYREMVSEQENIPRRIGIQMQSLLRPRVKETVAGFLAGTEGPRDRDVSDVVSWITNEVSAWLFIT